MNDTNTILIVEDNIELSDIMRNYLIKAGYCVLQAYDGNQAINMAKLNPSLILLDIMMPGRNGFEVCEILRKSYDLPIIVMSAKVEEADKIKMFELGADDYIIKPFSFKETVLRVNAQIRRYNNALKSTDNHVRTIGNLSIDTNKYVVTVNGIIMNNITSNEFKLIDILTSEPDRIFTKQQLLAYVWDTKFDVYDNAVTVAVARLREKLNAVGINNIVTVWGFGYKWQS